MANEIFKRILSSIVLIILGFYCIIIGSYFFYFMLAIIFLISSLEWHKMSQKNHIIYLVFIFIFFTILCLSTEI